MTDQQQLVSQLSDLLAKLQAKPEPVTLAERVKALRIERGWSLRQLEARANVGRNTINLIEHGNRPLMSTVERVASAFDMSLEELIHGVTFGGKS